MGRGGGLIRVTHGLCERQVGVIEGLDGANVLPVVIEQVCLHVVLSSGGGDDLAAKVVGGGEAPPERMGAPTDERKR